MDYHYTEDLAEDFIFDSHWILSNELFTKKTKFSLNPYTSVYIAVNLRWRWNYLPQGSTQPTQAPNHIVSLEASDIPSFQTEDYMPPENELKSLVDFIYSEDSFEKDPDK